jgi:1-acyl-sn-glycerol-3-phosphate acyltransferase
VLVANHASCVDSVMLMAALPVDYRFVVNHHLASYPFFGLAIRKSRYLIVDRTQAAARRACALQMIDTLRQGTSLLVFPEGTRHRGSGLLPFRPGAFRAAVEVGRPVIPITLAGTRDIWPYRAWVLQRGLSRSSSTRQSSPPGKDGGKSFACVIRPASKSPAACVDAVVAPSYVAAHRHVGSGPPQASQSETWRVTPRRALLTRL